MKPSDLRSGNYVKTPPFAVPRLGMFSDGIVQITAAGIAAFANDQVDYDPIILTEDWLIKFGFNNEIEEPIPEDGEFLVFFKDNFSVELSPSKIGTGYDYEVSLYRDVIDAEGKYAMEAIATLEFDIFFVHQLQNLYFALTKCELKIE